MKTILQFQEVTRKRLFWVPMFFITIVMLATTFWFVTKASAQTCTVCHKRTQTLMIPCNNSEYQRHLDHGDPPNACNTPMALDPKISGNPESGNLGLGTTVDPGSK